MSSLQAGARGILRGPIGLLEIVNEYNAGRRELIHDRIDPRGLYAARRRDNFVDRWDV